MIVEVLQYLFEADTSNLQKGEKEATKQNEKLNKELVKTDKLADNVGSGFTDMIASAGGALAALLSFSALSAGITETSAYVDNLGKTARMYDVNATKLASYQEVVKKSGGDISSFQGVIKKLNGDFNEFVTTGNTGILPFMQRLGIDMVDSGGKARSVLDVLPELADQFQTMSKAESAGLGEKLGLDEATIRLLQSGRSELEKQLSAQQKLFSITDEQISIFENFNDSVDDTKTAFRGLFVELGADILPILQYFMEQLQKGIGFLKQNSKFISGLFIALGTAVTAYAMPAIIKFGIASWQAFAPYMLIGSIIGGVAVAFALLYDEISTFISGGNSAFEDMLKWLGMTGEEIEALRQLFKDFGNSIVEIFSFLGNLIKGVFGIGITIAKGLYHAFEPMLWLFGKGIVGAIDIAMSAIKGIASVVGKISDFFGFGGDKKLELSTDENITTTNKNMSNQQSIPFVAQSQEENNNKKLEAAKQILELVNNNPLNQSTSNIINNSNANSSSASNFKIDKIEVTTQATDADAISQSIGNSLQNQFKKTTAYFEDGIQG